MPPNGLALTTGAGHEARPPLSPALDPRQERQRELKPKTWFKYQA